MVPRLGEAQHLFVKAASYLMKCYKKTKLSPDGHSQECLGNTQSNSFLKWKEQTKIIMMKGILDSKCSCLTSSIDVCVNTVLAVIKSLIVCRDEPSSLGIKLH